MADLRKDLALASQADAIVSSLPTLSSLTSTKGKNISDLSFMSKMECPQLWPNHAVTCLDVSCPTYGDLDMAQFVCGYLDCIRQSPIQLQPLMFDHLSLHGSCHSFSVVCCVGISWSHPTCFGTRLHFLAIRFFSFPSWSLSAIPRTSFPCL